MKQRVITLLVAILAAPTTSWAESGDLYGIIGLQHSKIDASSSTRSTDNTETGFDLGIGYPVHDNVAIELIYNDFNEYLQYGTNPAASAANRYTISNSATAWSLGGVFSYPVANKFDLIAKAGLFRWETETDYTRASTNTSGTLPTDTSVSGTDHYYGIGLEYNLENSMKVRVDHTKYREDGTTIDAHRTGVSLLVDF